MTAEMTPLTWTADHHVGERVHMLLRRRGMKQRELGGRLGLSEQTIGKKINAVTTFTLDELLLVARVLEVDVADLLPGAEYQPRTGSGRRNAAPSGGTAFLPLAEWDGAASGTRTPNPLIKGQLRDELAVRRDVTPVVMQRSRPRRHLHLVGGKAS